MPFIVVQNSMTLYHCRPIFLISFLLEHHYFLFEAIGIG